jgi:hypothetical protein
MTRQRGHWPLFVHEVVGGVWALVKWLLANVAVLVVIVAAMGVLAVARGVVDGFNRWVTGHRIAPAVVVAVTRRPRPPRPGAALFRLQSCTRSR